MFRGWTEKQLDGLIFNARRYTMKHYGDVSKINGAESEPVDVIIGGRRVRPVLKREGEK